VGVSPLSSAPSATRHVAGRSISLLAALEGAFVLARALRSTEPLEIAGAAVTAQVREAATAQRTSRSAHR
jgi:hypothetical protein